MNDYICKCCGKSNHVAAIQWPCARYEFIDEVLGGCTYNPIFFVSWVDNWLGHYVNNIYGYKCQLGSPYKLRGLPHNNTKNDMKVLYDHIIFLCLMELNSPDHCESNISLELFSEKHKEIEHKHPHKIESKRLYETNLYRFELYDQCKHTNFTKQRDLDYTFTITTNQKKEDCHIQQIIDALQSYEYPSYEVVIFSGRDIYTGEHVNSINGPDYGSPYCANICYQQSKGKVIIALTDYTIPKASVFDFIKSDFKIRTVQNG